MIHKVIQELKLKQHRDSMVKNYYGIWKNFNSFFVRLDQKPDTWEDRIVLYVGFLASEGRKANTINSYVSAIKAILLMGNIKISHDTCLIKALTKACHVHQDVLKVKLPIKKDLVFLILHWVRINFAEQPYFREMYAAVFATAYFGLFRIGELSASPHVVKVTDVHIATNKQKLMFILL